MILYFSGTGNSEYLANLMAEELEDESVNLFDFIKNNQAGNFHSEKPYILVTPTYGWRVPRFLSDYLKGSRFSGNRDIYVVINYGSSAGNADHYIRQDLESMGLNYRGIFGIRMPENYLAMFTLDPDEKNIQTVNEAGEKLSIAASYIKENTDFPRSQVRTLDRFLSSVVNSIFFKFIVKDRKFYCTDRCIQCGKCGDVCVLNNISYTGGFPTWNGHCTHCMACLAQCPTAAIEYGNKTLGKDRYLFKNTQK